MLFYTRKVLRVAVLVLGWLFLVATAMVIFAIFAVTALAAVSCAAMLVGMMVMPTDTTPAGAATAMVIFAIVAAGSGELVANCWETVGCYASWVREIINERPTKTRYVR